MKKVAVIGGGIIGIYIALKLKEKNLDVFLYDRKKEEEIGFKPCSTLVSERIRDFISFSDDCIENIIDCCKINFPKKTISLIFNPRHLVLNRDRLIKEQLKLLKQKGVNVILGENIKTIPCGFDYVIGCDGPFSIIRKELGLKDPKMKIGMQVIVDTKNGNNFTDVFPFSNGFLWKIPRGQLTEYGILSNSKYSKKILLNFLEKNNIEKKEFIVAPVPIGLIFSKKNNIALCGDAMGLTKPWSGGGIIWGLTAAKILTNTFPDFKEYEKQTKRFFNYKMFKGRCANKLVNIIGFNFPYIIPSKINYDNDFPNFIKSIIDLIRKK
ncbi:NAD(P)/FAD-dependent oxidoreductase [Candidatus Parcubacteria bacterium]|nr:NAD(P)/FAD-dependent oxidoreductase [Candidatus Parcubacteria bacterium]